MSFLFFFFSFLLFFLFFFFTPGPLFHPLSVLSWPCSVGAAAEQAEKLQIDYKPSPCQD